MLVSMVGMMLLGTGGHRVCSFSSVASGDHYFSEACSKAFRTSRSTWVSESA
jgi:hypothetical protein